MPRQIARRVHSAEYVAARQGSGGAADSGGKRRAVRYRAQARTPHAAVGSAASGGPSTVQAYAEAAGRLQETGIFFTGEHVLSRRACVLTTISCW